MLTTNIVFATSIPTQMSQQERKVLVRLTIGATLQRDNGTMKKEGKDIGIYRHINCKSESFEDEVKLKIDIFASKTWKDKDLDNADTIIERNEHQT